MLASQPSIKNHALQNSATATIFVMESEYFFVFTLVVFVVSNISEIARFSLSPPNQAARLFDGLFKHFDVRAALCGSVDARWQEKNN